MVTCSPHEVSPMHTDGRRTRAGQPPAIRIPEVPANALLKVWWIPQVPGKSFEVGVASVAEGVKIMETLANYDLFQLANRIKPDYANAGGLLMRADAQAEWENWEDEETGEDDPERWLAEGQGAPV